MCALVNYRLDKIFILLFVTQYIKVRDCVTSVIGSLGSRRSDTEWEKGLTSRVCRRSLGSLHTHMTTTPSNECLPAEKIRNFRSLGKDCCVRP